VSEGPCHRVLVPHLGLPLQQDFPFNRADRTCGQVALQDKCGGMTPNIPYTQRELESAAVAFAATVSSGYWMEPLPDISPPEGFLGFEPGWEHSILSGGSLDDLNINSVPVDVHMRLDDAMPPDPFAAANRGENTGEEPQRKRAREAEAERDKAINEKSLETYIAGLAAESTEGLTKTEGTVDEDDLGRDSSMSLGRHNLDRRKGDKHDPVHVARGNKAQRERQRRERLNER
jgi:hypothetical protein